MNDSIAAVVVTYNRKELLLKCLDAIRSQTLKVDSIFIVDNCSNDGTQDLLCEKQYIPKTIKNGKEKNQYLEYAISSLVKPYENIKINYISKYENDGGAGGFYEGMRLAYLSDYTWLWLMDDDGLPDNEQVKELYNYSTKNQIKYANALVINNTNHEMLAFKLKGYVDVKSIKEINLIKNYITPFNGTFIHRDVPKKIGFIKKEMFIWGDENEYTLRAIKNKISIATIIKAKHYHPEAKTITKKIIPGIFPYEIEIKPSTRMCVFIRNRAFILSNYYSLKQKRNNFIKYFLYYIFRLKFISLFKFISCFRDGSNNNFTRKII
ncbi:MAG: glycosyltransferase [Melioribacteraceae bacterium]